MKIKNPIIELLAIKLYEHDQQSEQPRHDWMRLPEDDRRIYRDIASGRERLP